MLHESAFARGGYQIRFPHLPLAVYREVAAHLRQVDGVQADLMPQTSQQFDYKESQIAGLSIQFSDNSPALSEQVEQILAYYTNRYGPWEEYDC